MFEGQLILKTTLENGTICSFLIHKLKILKNTRSKIKLKKEILKYDLLS